MRETPMALGPFQTLLVGFGIVLAVYFIQVYNTRHDGRSVRDTPGGKSLRVPLQVLRYSLMWFLAFLATVAILKLLKIQIDYLTLVVVALVSIFFKWHELRKPRAA